MRLAGHKIRELTFAASLFCSKSGEGVGRLRSNDCVCLRACRYICVCACVRACVRACV